MSDPFLHDLAETRQFQLGRPQGVQPSPDGRTILFLRTPPRAPTLGLFEYDVATGETRELVTPAQLLGGADEELSAAEKARRERLRIFARGFTSFALSPDGARVLLPLSGKLFLFDRASRTSKAIYAGEAPVLDPRFSPDGTRVAYVKANDVWVVDVGTGREKRITTGGTEEKPHGVAEFVAQEEMGRMEGYWWSPDGRAIAYAEVDHAGMERFAISDPARPEKGVEQFPYPRPGRRNAVVRLGVVPATGGRTTWVEWDAAKYPYLARVSWKEKAAPLTLLVQSRDQREEAVLAVDVKTGASRVLHVERDEAWVNLEPGLPRWLPGGAGWLYVSERSGRRELELRGPDGALKQVVIPGEKGVLRVAHVSPDGSWLAAVCSPTPVGSELWRFELGGEARRLLGGGADHTAVFAKDGSVFVDTMTSAEELPTSVVYRGDGTRVGVLPSVGEEPPFKVNLELTRVGAERAFDVAIVRPRKLEKGRKYPVIVAVYGGPHHNTVRADARYYLTNQWFADRGAIVVSVDNRGTPRRDRAWERAIKGNLGGVALDDQVEALRLVAAKYPELDLTRVGIYGWSFGGYMSALAVLKRPDVFKVGVAGAPVVDWLDYDTHYTERYMDLPEANPKGYEAANLVTWAGRLERPLLLVHGTGDDNVYFLHSLKLADALFRAGKRFDLLPLAGATHMVADPATRTKLYTRIADHLFEHL
ncbi:MAG: DPP IV N-terminal domain-containing protein [Myxococcales bacterium]